LLLEAMKQAGMGGVGRFVMRGSEYFCLIRPKGEALVLETLFLAEDVRSQAEIEEAVAGTEVKDAELKLAQQVMESLVAEFDPSELESQYRGNLRQMLEAKLEGQEIAKPEPVPEAPVVDLLEALKRSVAEAKGRKTATASKTKAAPKSGSRSRRQPARKSA
jgi:DNA end-binding protein Ku